MSNSKELSPFGQSALKLDHDFIELERLSSQIERLEIESDFGLERGKQLLAAFGECGMRISDGIQGLAKSLEEARGSAEKAATLVASRAAQIQKRQEECDKLSGKFQILGEAVRKVTASLAQFKKPASELTEEERSLLQKHLPEVDAQLGTLTEEASGLRRDARDANMRSLEQGAESLAQSLASARKKLGSLSA